MSVSIDRFQKASLKHIAPYPGTCRNLVSGG